MARAPRRPRRDIRHVFVDTSGYAALVAENDSRHADAVATARRLTDDGVTFVTTNLVMTETHALLINRLRRPDIGLHFLRQVARARDTTIVRVAESDEQQALELLARYQDKLWSLTDASSFVVMERLGIPVAFSFDRDFAQYGWTMLGRQPR